MAPIRLRFLRARMSFVLYVTLLNSYCGSDLYYFFDFNLWMRYMFLVNFASSLQGIRINAFLLRLCFCLFVCQMISCYVMWHVLRFRFASMSTLNSILCGYQPLSVGYSQNAADVRADRVVNNRCNSVTFGKEQYSSSDLVSLSWLQEGNILKITPIDNEEDPSRDDRFAIAHVTEGYRICDPGAAFTTTAGNRITIPVAGTGSAIGSPFVNAAYPSSYCQNLTKPCYSYTHLIFMAIESTPAKCMTVNQIYNWCETNFPFYKHAGAGWKNSLRHNLSINKSFKRLPRDGRVSFIYVIKLYASNHKYSPAS